MVELDPVVFAYLRQRMSGWQLLLPPTLGRSVLCYDCQGGMTMVLLAQTAAELTVVHHRPEALVQLRAVADEAGLRDVRFVLLDGPSALAGVAGPFDAIVCHDPSGTLLQSAPGRGAVDALCVGAAALLAPGGVLYLGFLNRFGYSRLRAGRDASGRSARLLAPGQVLRAVRMAGLTAGRLHALLVEGGRVVEVVPESGYRSAQNRSLATERLRRWLLHGWGSRHLAPAYGLVAFRGPVVPSWIDGLLAQPWIQERCPGARVRRHLVLGGGKTILALRASAVASTPIIAIIALSENTVARRRSEAGVLSELARLPEEIARTVPAFLGEHRFEEASVFLLEEFEGATVDRDSAELSQLTRLATRWLLAFHDATKIETQVTEEAWARLFGAPFQEARARNPSLNEDLTRLEESVRRLVMGRSLTSVWMHGDYKVENVVFDESHRRLLGVIDWELSRREGLPLLDLLYLLLYNRTMRSGRTVLDELRDAVLDGQWTGEERALLAEYAARFGGVAELTTALEAMFLVQHTGSRMTYDSRDSTVGTLRDIMRALRDRLPKGAFAPP